jgi:ABC-type nitrate/sulfonate/bicarbonate transport system substrate-binding protein
MKRSTMISLSAAALSATAVPARAQSTETVRFGIVPVEEAAMAYYAQEKGFFKAQGVTVELSFLPNGGSVTQGILGNALDVGVTNSGSISTAFIRGLPLYLLACGAVYSPKSPIAHIAVDKNSGIKVGKDLNGKTLSVSTLKDMIQGTTLAWLEKNGGDPKTVNFVEMPPVQMAAAIMAKRIDAGVIVEPFYTSSKNDLFTVGYNYSAVNNDKAFQTLGIAASKDWFTKNPATGKKIATAIHEAAKWANDPKNAAECARMLAAYTKVDPAVIAGYPRLAFAEANSPALVQPVIDLLARYTFIPHGFSATELFAPGVV